MSELEKSLQDFLLRWSRRKLGVAERTGEALSEQTEDAESATPDPPVEVASDAAAVTTTASLPPVDSINAASDIRAFLAPGVPIELTRAALRRAWASDPAIRDFIGLAENQWDFTQPNTVPGFGSLEFTPELRRMAAELFGEAPAGDRQNSGANRSGVEEIGDNSGKTATPDSTAVFLPENVVANPDLAGQRAANWTDDHVTATQNDLAVEEPEPGSGRRKHGGALPR